MRYPSAAASLVLVLVGVIFLLPKPTFAYEFNFVMPTFSWPTFNFSYPSKPANNFILPTMAPSVSPTTIPVITPNPTVAPTPTPISTIKPTTKPVVTAVPVVTTNAKDYIMNGINNYRAQNGLSKVQTDPNTCNFAKTRAQEISTSFNHNGFTNRVNSQTLPYPSYSNVTENIAMHYDYKQVVQMWINSPGHAANMRANTPYVCVEQYGNYYAYEGWRP